MITNLHGIYIYTTNIVLVSGPASTAKARCTSHGAKQAARDHRCIAVLDRPRIFSVGPSLYPSSLTTTPIPSQCDNTDIYSHEPQQNSSMAKSTELETRHRSRLTSPLAAPHPQNRASLPENVCFKRSLK